MNTRCREQGNLGDSQNHNGLGDGGPVLCYSSTHFSIAL